MKSHMSVRCMSCSFGFGHSSSLFQKVELKLVVFKDMFTSLRSLQIRDNCSSSLDDFLVYLPLLQELDFGGDFMHIAQPDACAGMLTRLTVSCRTTFWRHPVKFPRLVNLNLRNTLIMEDLIVEQSFVPLLTCLVLDGVGTQGRGGDVWSHLSRIWHLTSLQRLEIRILQNTNLVFNNESWPLEVSCLTGLTALVFQSSLAGTRILDRDAVSASLHALTNLKFLDLTGCRLPYRLPDTVSLSLPTQLRTLKISGNADCFLPSSEHNAEEILSSCLEEVELDSNQAFGSHRFPLALSLMPCIRSISLRAARPDQRVEGSCFADFLEAARCATPLRHLFFENGAIRGSLDNVSIMRAVSLSRSRPELVFEWG